MPSSWKRGNQQLNSEHPVPRGRPPKRCAGTSQNPNQRQNHLVLSNEVSSIDNNPHSAGNLQLFSADQLETLRTMIEDKVSESSRDIATEAARAAVTALRNQNSVAVGTTPQRDTNPKGATDPPRHTTSPGDPNPLCDNTESPQLPAISVPNQDIPASYVKDIQSGEFFNLSKLLPKNLSRYDEDDNLTLTLDNSAIKVTKKRKSSPSQITEIEERTTAFTTYTSVFTYKYPLRAQEFLQYLSLIRYAARVHKGLGWAIYDHKFRQKASLDKSLVWSQIDQHLWLTFFTVSPLALKEEYPLFNSVPQTMPKRGASEAFATNITELVSVVGTSASTNTSAIDVRANTQGGTAVGTATKEAMSEIRTREPMLGLVRRSTIPPNLVVPQATTNYEFAGSLPTPINVNRLEIVLADHPDRVFVSKLLQTFRLGANIGFFGRCSPRFSSNLPTALAQPDIVKANLDKEVSLGRVAGPFSTLPFPNFQVSTMGLVPKRYSDKFRTIFHLSFPKSGVTSINYSISKKDFS